jgi:hypothetical protein
MCWQVLCNIFSSIYGGDTQVKASITEDRNWSLVVYQNASTSSFTNSPQECSSRDSEAAMVIVRRMLNLDQFTDSGLVRWENQAQFAQNALVHYLTQVKPVL